MEMINSAYNGYLNQETPYITGEAPVVGKAKGMIRASKEAAKLSGKSITPFMRNGLGKRSSTLGSITANDIDESRILSGLPIKRTNKPIEYNKYSTTNIRNAANHYIKENKLETFFGPNGKMYVRTKDGKVRSFESVGREFIDNSGWY